MESQFVENTAARGAIIRLRGFFRSSIYAKIIIDGRTIHARRTPTVFEIKQCFVFVSRLKKGDFNGSGFYSQLVEEQQFFLKPLFTGNML